jgi:hypothetical protein
VIAIQVIRIHYDEGQRGRVDAEKRARRRAFPLPAAAGVHECHVSPKYEVHEKVHAKDFVEITDVGSVRVDDDELVLTHRDKRVFALREGQWGRLVANAKGGGFDEKWLIELVINAGLFELPPPAQIFFGKPAIERDVRRDFLRNAYR